jgi:hypothetical protein
MQISVNAKCGGKYCKAETNFQSTLYHCASYDAVDQVQALVLENNLISGNVEFFVPNLDFWDGKRAKIKFLSRNSLHNSRCSWIICPKVKKRYRQIPRNQKMVQSDP